MKLLNMHSVALMTALGLVLAGCGSSSNNPPSTDSGVPDGSVTDGAVTDGGPVADGGGDAGLTCVQRVTMSGNPMPSPTCAACICQHCENEANTCDSTAGCQDTINCANQSIGSCTCPYGINGVACVIGQCPAYQTNSAAQALGTCILGNCNTECDPTPPGGC